MRRLLVLAMLSSAATAHAEPFVDSADRKVELPAQVVKVLTAGPPASVIVYTLAPAKFLGWTRAPDGEALSYLAPRFRTLPAQVRITGRNSADPRAIKALGANVIVDFGTVNASYAAIADRTQAATETPYVLIDGAIGNTPAAYRSLGRVVQAGARGELLAGKAQSLLDEVASKLAGVAPKRVYVARGPDGNESYGAGSFTDEMMASTAAVNVAVDWGKGNLEDITPDTVREVNPDVVIATDPHFLEVIGRNPAWQQVPAIAAGRVHVAPRHPWGWIDEPPSVNRLIGLRWLAGVLHPDRFPGDIRAEAREFFRTFYQADLTAAQLDKLLANALPAKR